MNVLKFNPTSEYNEPGYQTGTVKNSKVHKYDRNLIKVDSQYYFEAKIEMPCYLGQNINISRSKIDANFVLASHCELFKCVIGENTQVMEGCHIEDVTLGSNVIVMPRIKITNCIIGNNVTIRRENKDRKIVNGLPTVLGWFPELKGVSVPDNSVVKVMCDNSHTITSK